MTESLPKSRIDYSYFDSLPNELIYKILCCDSIDLVHLNNLSYTCKRLNHLCSGYNNELWRLKFVQRWAALYNRIYANSLCSTYGCWRDELRSRYLYGKEIHEILKKVSHEQYFEGEMNFSSFEAFTSSHRRLGHPNGIHFQIDELDLILNDFDEYKNLTVKYYAKKVLRFLKHTLLRSSWINYFTTIEGGIEPVKLPRITLTPSTDEITVQMPIVEQKVPPLDVKDLQRERNLPGNFVQGAILFSLWCQPTKFLDTKFIYNEITHLAELIMGQLKAAHPKNAFFTKQNGKLLDNEESVKLEKSLLPGRDCKMVLDCISYFLYKSWKDSKPVEDEAIFIEDVLRLKSGVPLSLIILHQAIASKFGIKLIILDFPGHPILRWRDEEDQFFYIDVTNEGKIYSEDTTPIQEFINQDYNETLYQNLLRPGRILRSLAWLVIEEGRVVGASIDLISQRNGLELLRIVSPNDSEPKLLLSRIYIHLNINLEEVDNMLREINSTDPTSSSLVMFLYQSAQSQIKATFRIPSRSKPIRKRRVKNQDVKYAIGMIMKHEKYNYSCVIYSWDPICAASKGWTTQMRVSSLRLKAEQPFYNVLVEDGSTRYAAQENLSINEHPCPIPHSEIGKYFETFQGTHYQPNAEKTFEYPDDELTRDQLISNFYGDNLPIHY